MNIPEKGLLNTFVTRTVERTLRDKLGIQPIIYLDNLFLEQGECGVWHIGIKAEMNITEKDLITLLTKKGS